MYWPKRMMRTSRTYHCVLLVLNATQQHRFKAAWTPERPLACTTINWTTLLLSLHPLDPAMSRTVGRAPAFTDEENQALLDSLLPQYTKLYGRPGEQVTAQEKRAIWKAIVQAVRSVGVCRRTRRNIQKRWQDLRGWTRRIARVQLKLTPPRRRGAHRTLTPHMLRVLAVVFPDLDGQLQARQQQGGASSPSTEGDSCTEVEVGPSTSGSPLPESSLEESGGASATEGEGSQSTDPSFGDTSSFADGSDSDSLEEADVASPTSSTFESVTASSSPISTLPVGPMPEVRAAPHVSFSPGTAPPAPVTPAALSAESVDLLRQIHVGQTSVLTVLHAHTALLTQLVSFMEGMSATMSDQRRISQSMASSLTAAVSLLQQSVPPPPSAPSTLPSPIPVPSTPRKKHSRTTTDTSSTSPHKKKRTPTGTHTQGDLCTHTGDKKTHKTRIQSKSPQSAQPSPSTATPLGSPAKRPPKEVFLADLDLFAKDTSPRPRKPKSSGRGVKTPTTSPPCPRTGEPHPTSPSPPTSTTMSPPQAPASSIQPPAPSIQVSTPSLLAPHPAPGSPSHPYRIPKLSQPCPTPIDPPSPPSHDTPVSSGAGVGLDNLAAVCSAEYVSTFGAAPPIEVEPSTPAPTIPSLPPPVPAVPGDAPTDAPPRVDVP